MANSGPNKGIPSEEDFGTSGSLSVGTGHGTVTGRLSSGGAAPASDVRCCALDTDHDGNCPIHSSPGVRRVLAGSEEQ